MSLTEPALIQSKAKINYIDHLKVVLTAVVVLHHAFVTYGAPGGWYYSEKTTLQGAVIPMTLVVAVNQAFFMGFFFFLSSLFIPSSYNKKGTGKFMSDRLVRLGIPLIFYSFVLSPVINYLVYYFAEGHHITFLQFLGGYDGWIIFGVLWFVMALLLFTIVYISWRQIAGDAKTSDMAPPSLTKILLFAVAVGFVSFAVRIEFPVGWVLEPVGFQLGHFPQYIALFVLGVIASKNNWLSHITYRQGKQAAAFAAAMIFVGFPLIYFIKIKTGAPIEWFSGGTHWPSVVYPIWEQLVGFAIITALLGIGRQRWNNGSRFLSRLSRYAFGVYVFHPLVLISLSLLLRTWPVDPAVKLLVVAPAGIVISFLLSSVLVSIPGVNKVL